MGEEVQGEKVFGGGFLFLVDFRGRLVEWRAGQEEINTRSVRIC